METVTEEEEKARGRAREPRGGSAEALGESREWEIGESPGWSRPAAGIERPPAAARALEQRRTR
jgi:hypothetical protein